MSNRYDIGNLVRMAVAFTNASGAPSDPTTISLNVKRIGGSLEVFTYADNQIIKDSTGVYHYDYDPLAPGLYFYRFIGTGAIMAAGDSQFGIYASPASE